MRAVWPKLLSAILLLVALAQCTSADTPSGPAQGKARVQLMTSLPLVWGEDASMEAILSDRSQPAPIYRYWQEQYDVAAIDSLENLAQDDPDVLILAQPRALAPADLADLDAWVRSGGAVIILTDPVLVWPSALPLGDPRRPLASGLLSPLLGHWGLELVRPAEPGDGDAILRIGEHRLATRGAGLFVRTEAGKGAEPNCRLSDHNLLARCAIGEGQATLVADADFLDARFWSDDSVAAAGKSAAGRFIDALVYTQLKPESRAQ